MGEARHAEIAGAGMVGLTTAAALARRGWTVRVHERGPELREIGAGISIWSNGLAALEDVGALEAATYETDQIQSWQLRDEKDRILQQTWMLPDVAESFAILRSQLHQALADAAIRAGAEIVTSSPVAGALSNGTLVLESGQELEADLVVGADGVGSKVRDALGLSVRVRDLRDGCGRHLVPRSESDVGGTIIERWQGGRRIGIMPCGPDQTYIYLCCPEADVAGRRQDGDLTTWKDSFPELAEYIERIPPGGEWKSFADSVVSSWSSGHAAIVGDAASAMSPNLGQAACVGMMNAVSMANALDAHADVPSALQAWEASEREVTDATQRFSRFYGWIGTHWPSRALGVRSALIWALAHSSRAQKRINVAARHRPATTFPPQS